MNPRDEKILSVVHKRQKLIMKTMFHLLLSINLSHGLTVLSFLLTCKASVTRDTCNLRTFLLNILFSGTALPHKAIVNMNVLNTMTRKLRKTELFN